MGLEKHNDIGVDDTGSRKLVCWLCFVFTLGLFLIYFSQQQLIHASPIGEICREVGIAFCISVLVAGFIELSLSQRIFVRGLDAIMKRTVPPEVWEEFRQHVITQPMMRKDWTLTMSMEQELGGQYVSTTSVNYTIVSLKDKLKDQIIHEVDLHRTPAGHRIRFTRAMIGYDSYDSHKKLTDKKLLLGELKLMFPVKLRKNKATLPVEVEFKEKINCPDIIPWWMSRVTQNVKVTIEHLPTSWSVVVKTSHPAKDMRNKIGTNEWEFTGIMLPGQGFEIQIQNKR
jgi:hypothetical protein